MEACAYNLRTGEAETEDGELKASRVYPARSCVRVNKAVPYCSVLTYVGVWD